MSCQPERMEERKEEQGVTMRSLEYVVSPMPPCHLRSCRSDSRVDIHSNHKLKDVLLFISLVTGPASLLLQEHGLWFEIDRALLFTSFRNMGKLFKLSWP